MWKLEGTAIDKRMTADGRKSEKWWKQFARQSRDPIQDYSGTITQFKGKMYLIRGNGTAIAEDERAGEMYLK